MSFIGASPKQKRTRYQPQSADPVNPSEGDLFYADGTARAEGLYVYKNSVWTSITSATSDTSLEVTNLALSASVAANALTLAIKDKNLADASGSTFVAFRNATASTGNYTQVAISGALNLVISSGSTLGTTSGVSEDIFVYLINNSGTAEVAASYDLYEDGSIVSTTAEGGAGAADSPHVIYSTNARSNVPLRLIGRVTSTQTIAGTWATVPSKVTILPFSPSYASEIQLQRGNGHGSVGNKIRRFTTTIRSVGKDVTYTDSSTNGATFVINTTGIYTINYWDGYTVGDTNFGITINSAELATTITGQSVPAVVKGLTSTNTANGIGNVSTTLLLKVGDTVRPHTNGLNNFAADIITGFQIKRVS